MPVPPESYAVETSGPARRHLENDLPPDIALACLDFILGRLSENPYRAGGSLNPPYAGQRAGRVGDYRVRYEIFEHSKTVQVLAVTHRRHAYRPVGGAKRGRNG